MGILNITPDSFSDGGLHYSSDFQKDVECMIRGGADIIDVGGESTRPGAQIVSSEEELRRILPVIRGISESFDIPISVDTYKADVAKEALAAGAKIINDISGASFDPDMARVAADSGCPIIIMHVFGDLKRMHEKLQRDDIVGDVCTFLKAQIQTLTSAGVYEDSIIVDPGIGFGKTQHDNLTLINRLSEIKALGYPVLVGTSRKSLIGNILNQAPTDQRLMGTAATVALSIANGADIVRVHDVAAMSEVAAVADAIIRESS